MSLSIQRPKVVRKRRLARAAGACCVALSMLAAAGVGLSATAREGGDKRCKIKKYYRLEKKAESRKKDKRKRSNAYVEQGLWLIACEQDTYKAKSKFRAAYDVEPDNINAAYGLAIVYYREGKINRAKEILRPFESRNDKAVSLLLTEASLSSDQQEDLEDAGRILGEMRSLGCQHPLMPRIFSSLLLVNLRLKDFEGANDTAKAAEKCGLADQLAPNLRALVALHNGDWAAFEAVKDTPGVQEYLLKASR